jgi:hypothetical protein
MSKIFKRIGATGASYSVTITVHSVKLSLSLPVKLFVVWKRRNL